VQRLSASAACSRINSLDEAPADPQVVHRGLFVSATDEKGGAFTTVRSPFGHVGGVVPSRGRDSEALREEFREEDEP
jgi:crotonobetainyl-CoA:carnitine CoA-transferase CaiB-like acyl-CoA transferase